MKHLTTIRGREVWLECLHRPFEFRSPFDGQDVALMLVINGIVIDDAEQSSICDLFIRQGCRYAVCTGSGCSLWEDAIDFAFINTASDIKPPEDRFVMTTSHANESLKEAMWFFWNLTHFDNFKPERFVILVLGSDVAVEAELDKAIEQNIQ